MEHQVCGDGILSAICISELGPDESGRQFSGSVQVMFPRFEIWET
jgi:hypothetical protein